MITEKTTHGIINQSKEQIIGNLRIRRFNDKNWTIEEWTQGEIHRKTGNLGPDHWRIVGYYGKLEDLATGLLNRRVAVPAGDLSQQIPALQEAIKTAKDEIVTALYKTH